MAEPAVDPVDPVDDDLMLPDDYEEGKPYSFEEPDSPQTEDTLALPEEKPATEQPTGEQPSEEKPAPEQTSGDQAAGEDAPAADPAQPAADPAPSTYKLLTPSRA